MSKFANQPCSHEGKSFHSKLERDRYAELLILEKAGKIKDLQTQVTYRLEVLGHLICKYIADFVYLSEFGEEIVEDTKGVLTDVFRLKSKLMKACLGIDILLTRRGQVAKMGGKRRWGR